MRLAPLGALRLAGWFGVQAVRGAVDVAGRALAPALPVAPGWYRHPLDLPPGAPRLVMANAITLLPGTLTAELHGHGDAVADPAGGLSAPETAPETAPGATTGTTTGARMGATTGEGAYLVIHLLDARIDPAPELAALEARVRAAFGLPDPRPLADPRSPSGAPSGAPSGTEGRS